ncbi:MAG: LysR family transcriptional regulator [Lautropia sp.]
MMSLRQMEVFHAVMRAGSVTGAARLLSVSQPAISAVLKHCEASLKMRLFTRVGGRLQPTPEAAAIYPDVAAIYARVDSVGRLVQDLAGGRLGWLSIAAAAPIANGYLAEAVANYVAERPQVRVVLQSLTSPAVIDRVVSREAELGIAYDPVINAEVETQLLTTSAVACVMRKDHPLASRRAIDVESLRPYSIITHLPHSLLRPLVDRAFEQKRIVPNMSVQVGQSLTGMMLAFHGAGVALVEPSLLQSIPLPMLVGRPLKPRIELRTMMIRARSAPRSALLDGFVEHLRRYVPGPSSP